MRKLRALGDSVLLPRPKDQVLHFPHEIKPASGEPGANQFI